MLEKFVDNGHPVELAAQALAQVEHTHHGRKFGLFLAGLTLGQFAVLTVPGLLMRPKKWGLLRDALRDPALLTDLRAVGASYPQFARLPFTDPTDGVHLP